MQKETIKPSQEIYDRNTINARPDVVRNWGNVKHACDYLEQQKIEITVLRVVRHIQDIIKGKPSSKEHFYRPNQEYGRYVKARSDEQPTPAGSKKKPPPVENSYEAFMKMSKEDLAGKLIWALDDARHLKRDNNRLREAFGKLEFNPERFLANFVGERPPESAEDFRSFIAWLARCGIKVTPLALLFYDEHGSQRTRLANEEIIKSLAQMCEQSVDELVKFASEERGK